MKKIFFIIVVGIISYSCSLKTTVKVYSSSKNSLNDSQFIVFKETDSTDFKGSKIAEIHIKDAGLTLNCDYETVMLLAKKKLKNWERTALK